MLALVTLTIGCDQVTKHAATAHLAGRPPHSWLGNAVRLEYAENPGAFLSLGADLPDWARTAAFIVGTGLMVVGCGLAAFRRRAAPRAALGLALVFAGGVSNLADRIARGAVVDFLNVGIGSLRTGIFNVADMAILAGIGLLVFGQRRAAEPARRA